jgi:4-aminobutyrate aminotransferase-like enzyme/Ser/Thr protein kinase RdoA (MazF antagonist)
MEYTQLKITPKKAEEILFQRYNIKGKAFELPGYTDYNFRIKVDNENCFVLKISREDADENFLLFLQDILLYLEKNTADVILPKIIADKAGNYTSEVFDENKNKQNIRLLSWVSGRIWSQVNPQLDSLRFSLGEQCGLLTKALQGFNHPQAHGEFEWDTAQSLWTKDYLHLFNSEEQQVLSYFQNLFETHLISYSQLRKSVIHNDANDNNIIVTEDLENPKVKSIIDFGDAIYSQIINDVAVSCSYAIMDHNDPLNATIPIISGYHASFPLEEKELKHLYNAIAMRLVISYTASMINQKKEPDNAYLQISAKPAWELLKKWKEVDVDFAEYTFRVACGFSAHPNQQKFENWAKEHTFSLSTLFPTINRTEIHHLDLSVSSTFPGHQQEFNNLDLFQFKIDQLQKEVPNKILAGGYLEPRNLYTSTEYDTLGNNGKQSRTVHIGVDFWLPENTPVHALLDGEVVIAENDIGDKEYGGLIVLKHQQKDWCFYTLYGHNTPESVLKHKLGDVLKKGEQIADLANYPDNGNWAPHLHFQVMLSLLDYKTDFPGVAYFNQIEVWKSICPNPNLLFKINGFKENLIAISDEIIAYRKQHLGKGMSLQYKMPLHIVKGANQYLIDAVGRKYLDTVNNVAHVGHENFNVVKAGQHQMALLNTNTRYLNENINTLAKEILETLPKELSVLHFVNSGSEANELAIRMIKCCTNSDEIIASEHGYHGNTSGTIHISSYKFDGKGGSGKPKTTHIFPIPDAFRGKFRGGNSGEKYAQEVQLLIDEIHQQHKKVGGFIIEPIISCGGQVALPSRFLQEAYKKVRKAGGLCISDEVQTGIGRMGKTFWGFELHNVIPDIVTMGKPLGNGHPIAAVACTKEVAEKFANGMEFFNTFGGNPVSCAIATEVLREVKREKLQENALEVGEYLKSALKQLSKKFPIIGDVRGQGLFLGIELVDQELHPLAEKTDYVVNRMKEFGILMSSDGPNHNVIKIKPPLTFTIDNAQEVVFYLQKIFGENFMKII